MVLGKGHKDFNASRDKFKKMFCLIIFPNFFPRIVKSSKKVFQDAELYDSKGDEERSFVLYLKYFNIVQQIKQKADYKKQMVSHA